MVIVRRACSGRRPTANLKPQALILPKAPGARATKNAQGIAHMPSAPKAQAGARKHVTAGHQLLHRRTETSLYVRSVAGVAGHNSIVKNAGKEKASAQAVVREAPCAAEARTTLKDARLLARYVLRPPIVRSRWCTHITRTLFSSRLRACARITSTRT